MNKVGREAEPVGPWDRDLLAGNSFGHWRTVPGRRGYAVNKLSPACWRPLLRAVFTGWALTHNEHNDEFSASDVTAVRLAVWSLLIRFVTPVALILIFLHQVRLS
jgi:hypothetical protein